MRGRPPASVAASIALATALVDVARAEVRHNPGVLQKHAMPTAVLNTSQAGLIDAHTEGPSASVREHWGALLSWRYEGRGWVPGFSNCRHRDAGMVRCEGQDRNGLR